MFKFLFILGFVLSPFGFSGWSSTVAYATHKGAESSEGHYCATKYDTTWPTMQERVNYIYNRERRFCHDRATAYEKSTCIRIVKPCLEWLQTACDGKQCTEKVEKVEPLVSTMSKASSEYLDKFDKLYPE